MSVYTDIEGQGGRSLRRPRLMKHASWTRAMSSSVVKARLWKRAAGRRVVSQLIIVEAFSAYKFGYVCI
jgi:hypothetical protein